MKNKPYYPETLKSLPIWALWKLETDPKGRPTKVPYSTQYNGKASSTNPRSWGTFDQAMNKLEAHPDKYNGIALVISKEYGLIFIDIDHCISDEGEYNETAMDIVNSFGTQFMEYSQSGTGIHIITKGQIPKSFKNSGNGVEMYDDKRFCAMTGNALYEGEPMEEQSVLDDLYQKYKTSDPVKKSVKTRNMVPSKEDQWVIDHASKRGVFKDLYNGDWRNLRNDNGSIKYGSQSEADAALCTILAYWTDCNQDQIDRIFRTSGLYREKWERDDYRESTILGACLNCDETISDLDVDPSDWRREFHKWTKPNKDGESYPKDTIDDRIVEDIIKKNNMFRLFGKIYIQDKSIQSYYRMDDDESILRSTISKYIYEYLLTSTRVNRIYNLFDAKPQLRVEEVDINNCPRSWMIFQNGILDAKTMQWYEHDTKYRCVNMIPHDYDPDYKIPSDSVSKSFIESLIPQDDDREMFLEYCGYCATFDTSMQKFMMLRGKGGVGKSVLLRLQRQFVGSINCSGLTLQNLNDRFSPAFLFGKLMNIYADTPSTDMDEINGIKTITGEDTIRAEYKGGDVFFFNPYCKLLYSTNKVPKSRDDKTNAYYRRLLILPIEKRAKYVKDLEERLAGDIDSYIHLCVEAAHRMYERGYILESKSSKREVLELYMATDSVKAFLHDRTIKSKGNRIERTKLYRMYCDYCDEEGRERSQLSKNGFYQNLRDKGYSEIRDRGGRYFVGLDLIPEGFEQVEDADPF